LKTKTIPLYFTAAIIFWSVAYVVPWDWAGIGLIWIGTIWFAAGTIEMGYLIYDEFKERKTEEMESKLNSPDVREYRALASLTTANTAFLKEFKKAPSDKVAMLLAFAPYMLEVSPTGDEILEGYSFNEARMVLGWCENHRGRMWLPLQHGLPGSRLRGVIKLVTDDLIVLKKAGRDHDKARAYLLQGVDRHDALKTLAEYMGVRI
jgi:hypothetical protein